MSSNKWVKDITIFIGSAVTEVYILGRSFRNFDFEHTFSKKAVAIYMGSAHIKRLYQPFFNTIETRTHTQVIRKSNKEPVLCCTVFDKNIEIDLRNVQKKQQEKKQKQKAIMMRRGNAETEKVQQNKQQAIKAPRDEIGGEKSDRKPKKQKYEN